MCSYFIYNPNSKTENELHGRQAGAGHRGPTSAPAGLWKERWESSRAAARACAPHRCSTGGRGHPAHDRTAQVRSPADRTVPPPRCALGLDWIVGLEPQTVKGEGKRDGSASRCPRGCRSMCTGFWALGKHSQGGTWKHISPESGMWDHSCWPRVQLCDRSLQFCTPPKGVCDVASSRKAVCGL